MGDALLNLVGPPWRLDEPLRMELLGTELSREGSGFEVLLLCLLMVVVLICNVVIVVFAFDCARCERRRDDVRRALSPRRTMYQASSNQILGVLAPPR